MNPTDKAIEFRDRLSSMVGEVEGSSQEDHIVRCCLALAIEGLEEWIYDGEFYPSVEPTNSEGHVYQHEEGVVFKRETRRALKKRHPTVVKLASEGKLKAPPSVNMGMRQWDDMTPKELQAFLEGNRQAFIQAIRTATNCGIRGANDFCKRMRMAHMKNWGSRKS